MLANDFLNRLKTLILKSDSPWVKRSRVSNTGPTDAKLPLDAQFAVGNTAPEAQDSEVDIPTGSDYATERRERKTNIFWNNLNAVWK